MAHHVYVVEIGTLETDNIGSEVKVFVDHQGAADYFAAAFTQYCPMFENFKITNIDDGKKILFFDAEGVLRKSVILTKTELCGDSYSYFIEGIIKDEMDSTYITHNMSEEKVNEMVSYLRNSRVFWKEYDQFVENILDLIV